MVFGRASDDLNLIVDQTLESNPAAILKGCRSAVASDNGQRRHSASHLPPLKASRRGVSKLRRHAERGCRKRAQAAMTTAPGPAGGRSRYWPGDGCAGPPLSIWKPRAWFATALAAG
jgi:hypothetical protein